MLLALYQEGEYELLISILKKSTWICIYFTGNRQNFSLFKKGENVDRKKGNVSSEASTMLKWIMMLTYVLFRSLLYI